MTEVEGRPQMSIDGEPFEADVVRLADGVYSLIAGNRSIEVAVSRRGDDWEATTGGRTYRLQLGDGMMAEGDAGTGDSKPYELRATLPGKVLEVHAAPGQEVQEGVGLVVVEAMKMENELRAPFDARVEEIAVKKGQTVETGALLCVLFPQSGKE